MMMMFTYREECSYICSCFCFLPVDPLCDCRVVYTPAAEASVDTELKMIPTTRLFIIKVWETVHWFISISDNWLIWH